MDPNIDWNHRVTRARQELQRPAYLEADIARATDVAQGTLDNWIIRGIIEPASGPPGKGGRRQYSALNAIEIALVGRLVEVGLAPQHAARIAKQAAGWIIEDHQVIHYETLMVSLPAAQLVVTSETEAGRIESPPLPICGAVSVIIDIAAVARDVVSALWEPYRLKEE
jgi:hypothetical protein